ncbi:hypothetical protein NX059_008251 [Plenodomus lindquistii]|nr:hypothetical protein NX059_008251 [Plenodomus lindquistii]
MGDKDPPPFGCMPVLAARCAPALTDMRADTFSDDFFADPLSTFDADAPPPGPPGQSLLNDMENQSLADFFSNTDPFHLTDPASLTSPLDSKDAAWDYNNWGDFMAPAVVHRVTTTIPDQAQLQHNYYHEPTFTPAMQPDHLGNTPDDLQAAETLFHTTQPSYATARAHGHHGQPTPQLDTAVRSASTSSQSGRPMVITPHGPITEQLAALLPNHTDNGNLDAQLAAHWATNKVTEHIHKHYADTNPVFRKPNLKQSYTFGTDGSFNNRSGFLPSPNHGHSDTTARQSQHNLDHSQLLVRSIVGALEPATSPPAQPVHTDDVSEDGKSGDGTSGDESSDKPPKKRRKNTSRVAKESPRKATRTGKTRKTVLLEDGSKKKRASAAAQKLQRENLTEEQKRNNHILSEQKRRNLIKRGFDDLHDLVPEIRNGGLSKSSVLTEAGNFLEKLIQDNQALWKLVGGASASASGPIGP